MTIGIYSLTFKGFEDQVYIGQSINIEIRYICHKSCLRLNKSNYKLLEAFKHSQEYPELNIIEICKVEELDIKELEWIHEFDSISNGLNLTDKVSNKGYGEDNFNSKYTNLQIIDTFTIIASNIGKTNKQLAALAKIPVHVIEAILSGRQHLWLSNYFDIVYTNVLLQNKGRVYSAERQGIEYPKIVSPEGIEYTITNLSEFSREHNINKSSLCQVLHGQRKTCNKWKLAA